MSSLFVTLDTITLVGREELSSPKNHSKIMSDSSGDELEVMLTKHVRVMSSPAVPVEGESATAPISTKI